MLDKLCEIKNNAVDRIMNLGLVKMLEIGSGLAVIFGAVLINALSDNDLMATDIVENYDPDAIEIDDAVVEDATSSDE